MEPEVQPPAPEVSPAETASVEPVSIEPFSPAPEPWENRALRWTFLGPQGLRAGWSVLCFVLMLALFVGGLGLAFLHFHIISKRNDFTASSAFWGEMISFLALLGAASLMALIERRRNLLAFNLTGPRPAMNFFSGFAVGFAALSALIGGLAWGGWLHFGPVALSGTDIFKFGALWCAAFLLVGCFEEGMFRCYLQFTLTRGINFWWALGVNALVCGELLLMGKGNGIWGIYGIALLGLVPCLLLHLKKVEGGNFWQAAWVTSTLFGFIHTGNNGENWIGIFAAALIGFAFCVSVRVTGSAWWAIGCHAAWDWAETYFYGAADSGNVATGHYLTTAPAGAVLWSGGTDGPEGSLLVLPIILLIMLAVIALHGRRKPVVAVAALSDPVVG
jgi:membrane protease YdiL (CAAX protease family)